MKLSLVYVYQQDDCLLKDLIRTIKKKTGVELIILSHLSKSQFLYNKLLDKSKNVSFHTFPKMPIGFFYNQGINLAKANLVEIVNDPQTAFDDYSKNLQIFKDRTKTCVFFPYKLTKININKRLFFNEEDAWLNYCQFNAKNYFLNKTLLVEHGLFFYNHCHQLAIIDLLIRIKYFKLGIVSNQSLTLTNREDFQKINYFNLGQDLFWLFFKYNKSKRFLLSYLLKIRVSSNIFANYLALLGLIIAYIQRCAFIQTRKFILKIALTWNKLSRQLRLNKCILFPIELAIEPTNYCNSNCPLCPTGSKQLKRAKGYMSFALFKKIIDEGKFFLNRITLWNLGEPFLNSEIYSMIQYAKHYNIRVVSSTNGYAFYTKAAVNQLVESKLDSIIVAADGADEKTFTQYRKGTKYKETLAGLHYLHSEKKRLNTKQPSVELQLILMKQTLGQIKLVKQLAKKLGANFVMKYLSVEMVNDVSDKQKFLPKNPQYSVYKNNGKETVLERKMQNVPCVAWDGMVVNWDGTVNPCIFDYYSNIVLGNLQDATILSLWHSKKFNKLRRDVLTNKQNVAICKHCPINSNYSELCYYND